MVVTRSVHKCTLRYMAGNGTTRYAQLRTLMFVKPEVHVCHKTAMLLHSELKLLFYVYEGTYHRKIIRNTKCKEKAKLNRSHTPKKG